MSIDMRRAAQADTGGRSWFVRRFVAALRGFGIGLMTVADILAFTLMTVSAALILTGVGVFALPPVAAATRALNNAYRRLAKKWTGVDIPEPYLPREEQLPGVLGIVQRPRAILIDPATRRDLLYNFLNPIVGMTLGFIPLSLMAQGVFGWIMPFVWKPIDDHGGNEWFTFVHVTSSGTALACVPLGVIYFVLGLALAPTMLKAHANFSRSLLGPTPAALEQRVRRLTETRHDAVDVSAAELRRIERDLHDGAQARLVAMGMNLGAVEELMERDPEAAKALLAETRLSSAKALGELRNLVRGIHPPILADRGLGDAVRALALDHPMPVEAEVDLPGRLELPVESAVYFAISETLTNVVKHAAARRIWVDLRWANGILRATITDDGVGGVDPSKGTGLRGIERRLGTFDGILAVSSPHGGPTVVTMEVPCALAQARSTSS